MSLAVSYACIHAFTYVYTHTYVYLTETYYMRRLTSTALQGSRNWGLVTVLLVVMLLLLMAGVESQVRGMAGRERHTEKLNIQSLERLMGVLHV